MYKLQIQLKFLFEHVNIMRYWCYSKTRIEKRIGLKQYIRNQLDFYRVELHITVIIEANFFQSP